MEFEVLGSVRIRSSERVSELTGRMQRTLFGTLLASARQPVPVPVLIDAVWAGRPDPGSAQKLQVHVHRLRRMLDEPARLVLLPEGYRLEVLPGELDAERFELLAGEAEDVAGQEPERAAGLIRKAMTLWRGDPYGGLDLPVLAGETERLVERRLAALELLYETELRCGRHPTIVAELADLVRRHPLRERLHGSLMVALYRGGRQAEALDAYQTARRYLIDELGLEPGAELRRIEQRILAGEEVEWGTPAHPAVPPARPAAVPAQLPHDVRGFVGREHELAELDGLLATAGTEPVLISAIAGTAGVGKTALAIRWAHHAQARFPDGQLYVDLRGYGPEEPVTAHDALAGFLRALGVDGVAIPTEPAERAAYYRTLLAGRRMLIVLDNARTIDQIRPLLPGGRSCFALVTSRDSLIGLAAREGAHRIMLDRLPADEARELFLALAGDRARADPAATAVLVERCARLPLALRVAAEVIRTRHGTSVATLVDELTDQQSGLDVLDIDGDPHTAVRAVFSWSYRHLRPDVARLFRLWGLHTGPDVAANALAALADTELRAGGRRLALLVQAHMAEEDTDGRFRMHDLMRAYARERVAEDEPAAERDAAIRRLLTWYLHTAVAARLALDPRVRRIELGEDPPRHVPAFDSRTAGLRWFERERPNLVAVVRLAAERGEHVLAWQLTTALLTFFHLGKHWDDWITTHRAGLAAARTSGDLLGQAHVLNGLGVAHSDLGRFTDAIEAHREAAELYARTDDRSGEAWNLNNLGVAYDDLGRFPEAVDCYDRALELFRELGDARGHGLALSNLGDVYRQRREPDRAIEALREAMAVQQAAGDLDGQRFCLANLGDLHREAGSSREAADCYEAALAISKDLGDRWQVARLVNQLADVLHTIGETTRAAAYSRESMALLADLRARPQAQEYLRRAAAQDVDDDSARKAAPAH